MCCSTPSPPHFGQAPNGLLNENSRGSISGMVKPDTGQANFSENTRRSAVSLRCLFAFARSVSSPPPCGEGLGVGVPLAPLRGVPPSRRFAAASPARGEATDRSSAWGRSANSATARPSASLSACSSEFGEPRRDIGPHHHAVDHDVDVVGEFLVERRRVGDLVELAVDLDALVALLHELGEFLAVLALAAAHHRREQIKPRAFRQRQDAVDHLRHGLAFDRQAGRGRVGHADARPQQPHVVVDLGDGADRRARIARGGLLLDRDGGRQAVDLVDVRLLHHLQELPRVGRQAFDVAALALGIDGVEGERGLARARQAGEHHELVARNIDIDVLEIVLARAADRERAAVAAAGRLLGTVGRVSVEHVFHGQAVTQGLCDEGSAPAAGRSAGERTHEAPAGTQDEPEHERSENAGDLPERGVGNSPGKRGSAEREVVVFVMPGLDRASPAMTTVGMN